MRDRDRLKKIIEICLEEPISLKSFFDMCEDDWDLVPLFSQILDNIESQLEHADNNIKKYYNTNEYFIMKNDLELINKFDLYSENEILIIRNKYIR